MSTQAVPESTLIKPNPDEGPPIAGIDGAVIKAGRPERLVSEWGKPFLKNLRKSGNISRSARKARVSPTTVRKYAKGHAAFRERIASALREYGDSLEENLGRLAFKGNAIANISRLKALNERLARKYSEKAVDARVLNLQVNNYGAPAALPNPHAFLLECMEHATDATREEIRRRALPAGSERSDAILDAELEGAADAARDGVQP